MWLCSCECGQDKEIPTGHLTRKLNPVKSCGCLRFAIGSDNPTWTGVGDISGSWWVTHVLKSARTYRRKEVSITKQYAWDLLISQKHKCTLTGLSIKVGENASLDRIDSAKDYEAGNVQWVHKDVNIMKNKFSSEYFLEMCKRVVEYSKLL